MFKKIDKRYRISLENSEQRNKKKKNEIKILKILKY